MSLGIVNGYFASFSITNAFPAIIGFAFAMAVIFNASITKSNGNTVIAIFSVVISVAVQLAYFFFIACPSAGMVIYGIQDYVTKFGTS